MDSPVSWIVEESKAAYGLKITDRLFYCASQTRPGGWHLPSTRWRTLASARYFHKKPDATKGRTTGTAKREAVSRSTARTCAQVMWEVCFQHGVLKS
jgi:hypothetical protein